MFFDFRHVCERTCLSLPIVRFYDSKDLFDDLFDPISKFEKLAHVELQSFGGSCGGSFGMGGSLEASLGAMFMQCHAENKSYEHDGQQEGQKEGQQEGQKEGQEGQK